MTGSDTPGGVMRPCGGFSLLRKYRCGWGRIFCKSSGKEAVASPFFVQILVRELQLAFLYFFLFANACRCAGPRGGIWDLFGDGNRPREAQMEAMSKQNNARNAIFLIFLKFVILLCFREVSESHF